MIARLLILGETTTGIAIITGIVGIGLIAMATVNDYTAGRILADAKQALYSLKFIKLKDLSR